MNNQMKNALLFAVCGIGLGTAVPVQATNWLMLQGTEPSSAAGRAKVFGFLQPTYQKDTSDEGGPEPTRIGPSLEEQSAFQLYRARIGVRGTAMPIDSNVNYFIMAEFGENGATNGGKYGERTPVRLMDASVTLNHIPGIRVRTGLFKTPGPEEILQGIATFDYINMTDVSNQLMMERYPAGVNVTANGTAPLTVTEADWDSSFGAGRDIGVQLFDSFPVGNWDHSYALMIGNGNGLESSGIADGTETYIYWSSERRFEGGVGPWVHGLKLFAWSHNGKRKVDLSDDGVANPIRHDRKRQGAGMRYRQGDWRATVEYMAGEGMIFQGPEKPNMGIGTPPALQDLDGKANGYYVDVGYYIPHSKWELDLRYDVYNRSTDHEYLTAKFKTLTYGAQYHFNRKTRVAVNYAVRDAEATDPIGPGPLATPTTNLHNGLASIKNRMSVQVTLLF
jgi:hypothetical protein